MAEATAQSMQSVFEMVLRIFQLIRSRHMLDLLGKDDDVVNMTPEQLQLLVRAARVKAGKAACVKERAREAPEEITSHPRLHQVWGSFLSSGRHARRRASFKRAVATRAVGRCGPQDAGIAMGSGGGGCIAAVVARAQFAALELLARLADDATLLPPP